MAKSSASLHGVFIELLPHVERHCSFAFRHVACQDRRADLAAEVAAITWKWLVRLREQKRNVNEFRIAFIITAIKAVRSGRRVCGREPSQDAMSPVAQRQYRFTTLSWSAISASDRNGQDAMGERLRGCTRTPVADQAAFRIDFPAWLATRSGRERRIIKAMMKDIGTGDLSRRFNISAGRVSQLRRAFQADWQRYIGDDLDAGTTTEATAATAC